MHISSLLPLAIIPALAAATSLSASADDDFSLISRGLNDADIYADFYARGIDLDDEDIFDLAARDVDEEDLFDLVTRGLDEDDLLDILLARGPIYGDSSDSHSVHIGKGEHTHSGPGIKKTTEVSVTRDPPVRNFSYPRGHPKNPKRSLNRRGPIYGDSSDSHSVHIGKGEHTHSGPGIKKTTEVSVTRDPPVRNFSYPRGHPKNPKRSLSKRSPIYGDSSDSHSTHIGKGEHTHTGPGIKKTTEYSVTRNPPVRNFSYPKGHPKNP